MGDAPTAVAADKRASRRFGQLLPFIVVLGAVIRVAYAVGWRIDRGLQYDGPVYRNRAAFLLSGRSFQNPDAWTFHHIETQGAIHPPVNTVLLALARQLGIHSDGGLQLWGCLIGTITIVVVALLGRVVAGPRTGLIAGFLAAVHPALWSYDPTAMAESPGQLLTAVTLLLAYRFWSDPRASRAAWLGGAAALAALTRSELALLIPILVISLCVAAPGTRRQTAGRLGAALLWVAMVLAPWVGWNLVRFEHPVALASGLDISLAYAQCDDTWYGPHTGYWNVFCGAEIARDPGNEFADESELGARYRARAGRYILDHPTRWPVVVAARAGRTLGVYRPLQQIELEHRRESRETAVLWGAAIATWLTMALAGLGFARPPGISRARLLPLLTPLVVGAAGAALTFGTTRYRSSGEIGLIVLAAVGVDTLGRVIRRRRPPEPDRVGVVDRSHPSTEEEVPA